MKEQEFILYLKDSNRSELTIETIINALRHFVDFLKTINVKIEKAKPKHLKAYLKANRSVRRIRMHYGSIGVYYKFLDDDLLHNTAREIGGELLLENYSLKKFHLVNLEYVSKLEEFGIKTAKEMLGFGLTQNGRKEISQKTSVPEFYILELVKLSNLARIPGLKKIRARLYYDAGIDTLVKLATWKPEDLKNLLDKHAEKTGIAKMGVLLAEATSAISLAKHLPKIVEF